MAKRDESRSGEGRLARWSRLKREAVAEKKMPAPPPTSPEAKTAALTPAAPATPPEAGRSEEQKKIDAVTKDLPPLESLGPDSDYSLFMREGVPNEQRTAALRKLWRSDPAFTEKFPYEIHMEDYNETFTPINAATDTIFRAGLGYLFDDDDKATTEKPLDSEIADQSAPSGTETGGEMPRESAESMPAAKEEIDKADLTHPSDEEEASEEEKTSSEKSRAG